MAPKVLVTSPLYAKNHPQALELLKHAGIEVHLSELARAHTDEEILSRGKDADGLLVWNTFDQVNRKVIFSMPHLRVISRHGVGIEMIDCSAAGERGIVVANTSSQAEEDAVADFTIGLLINLCREIVYRHNATKAGLWMRGPTRDFSGKSIGVIGLGRIGRAVVQRAKAFKLNIMAYEPYPDSDFCSEHHVDLVDLPTLLRNADFVTLHVPLTDQTRRMIGADELALMKPDAFLVNAARAAVVDGSALKAALESGRIAGAAVDVYENEPPQGDPIVALNRVICTPHVAGLTETVIRDIDFEAARNLIQVLSPLFET